MTIRELHELRKWTEKNIENRFLGVGAISTLNHINALIWQQRRALLELRYKYKPTKEEGK